MLNVHVTFVDTLLYRVILIGGTLSW